MKSLTYNFRSICIALACLALTSVNSEASLISGPITNPANGHVYYLLNTTTWTNSEAEAISLGGHLAIISNSAENNWVYNTFSPLIPTFTSTYWIGLSDAAQEGHFVWANGEAVSYTNWSNGQPDNARGNENYVHVWTPGSMAQDPTKYGQWNDLANDWVTGLTPYGVVEIGAAENPPEPPYNPPPPPPITTPIPGALWLFGPGFAFLAAVMRRGQQIRKG